ncbi:MAG: phosphoenolpyruvate carboxykinase (ATP) [Chitinophagales bacterium]|jgi:phosphoenolpyruvate carboxykinase (ATP)|nr:phosphoenolpyruvate carboxykinase (ATP) [Sphingobacteriales bacterium]MCC7057222.1 phosphoenolpyruvate carboxykinase (ATP) [Chitinophagales bacterium]
MENFGRKSSFADLSLYNITDGRIFWNLTPAELVEKTITLKQGSLSDTGALAIDTGEFTGRSPDDKFTVQDDKTRDTVNWAKNNPISEAHFEQLYQDITAYLTGKDMYVMDACACAHPDYALNVRAITEYPWQSLFVSNMFIRLNENEIASHKPDWVVINAPGFHANAKTHGTRQHNFAAINFTRKMILIGGTAYTGEIKKGIFTVLNYILPQEHGVLSMHCSANVGQKNDTALFFGLSGTGKTTLSADPNRRLIGDDEHGWSKTSVFNFEGGCYAKCIDLTAEKEPQIYGAIKFGALLENIAYLPNSRTVDFSNATRTENTRASYPIDYINNIMRPSAGSPPQNIFFLTCDAFGILPPISRLTTEQAMYHFIAGYTAKVAGTEAGVTEPKDTFSACFGLPFLPLHPAKYARLLGRKIEESAVEGQPINVWLINTGWTGGPYGVGNRMKLSYTRAMITAALEGQLNKVTYETDPLFGLHFPTSCPNVPAEVLNPRNTWPDKSKYDLGALALAKRFHDRLAIYADHPDIKPILTAAPVLPQNA